MNKRIILSLLLFFTSITQLIFCQEIYYINQSLINKADIGSCNGSQTISPFFCCMTDIAFHPNGDIYVITEDKLFRFDISLDDFIEIGSFNQPGVGMTSLTFGNDGTLYGAGEYTNTDEGRLFELNTNTGNATFLGSLPSRPYGDLAFLNGKLYLTAFNNSINQSQQLIEVNINNPENSIVLCQLEITSSSGQDLNVPLYGLMGYTSSCNESYLIVSAQNQVHYIDVETCIGTYQCTVLGTSTIYGLTMPTDYIAQSCCSFDTDVELDNPDCSNSNSGSITIQDNGNNHEYQWNTGATSSNINNLPAGTYSVTLTTTGNCSVDTTFSLVEPTPIIITGSSINASCENNGSIDISASGGSGSYSFLWSPSGGTVEDPQNLAADSYSLIVTDTDGCTATFDIEVNSDTGVEITSIYGDNLLCNNDFSGNIDLEVALGTSPYFYTWNNFETTQDLDNLAAGIYQVTVSDSDGCTASTGIIITEPEEVIISFTTETATCGESNGSINLTVSGGSTPYSYQWQDINNTSPNPQNLASGFYTVTVTDENSCTSESTILVPSPAGITLIETISPISCFGNSTGSISIQANGGTPPYSFLWSTNDNTNTIDNLFAGTYQITVTDINNCNIVGSYAITEPLPIIISSTSINATCGEANGSIDITASGGIGSYHYQWNPELGNTPNPTGLLPGNYSVTVTDDNLCTNNLEVSVSTPSALSLSTTTSSLLCNGDSNGSIDLSLSGGVPPFSYLWNTGAMTEDINGLTAGNYFVTVTDTNNCPIITNATITEPNEIEVSAMTTLATCNENNGSIDVEITNGVSPYNLQWSNGSNGQNLENLAPGLYELTVTDTNQCTASFQTTLATSTSISFDATISEISCNGAQNGSILIDNLSGEAPFSFLWSIDSTTQNLEGLNEGVYALTITDAYSCTAQVTYTINEPALLEAFVINPTALDCNGDSNGSIQLQVIGGINPYSFLWSNGMTIQNPENLTSGNYLVTITDANDCTTTVQTVITQPESLELECNILNHVSSPNGNEGLVSINPQGGIPPFQIFWMGAATGSFFQNDPGVYNIVDLVSGSYSVIVSDSNNCNIECIFEILEFECNLTTELNGASLECYEDQTGVVDLTIYNGVEPFIIDWNENNLDGLQTLTGLTAGEYAVTVTDAFECSDSAIISLSQPEEVNLIYHVTCYDENSGTLTLEELTGGTGNFEYAIESMQFQEAINLPIIIEPLDAGNLELVLQYNNFCQESYMINIPSTSDYQVNLGEDIQLALGEDIILEAETNFNPISIMWFPTLYLSDTTSLATIASPVNNSTYILTTIADNGCSVSDRININVFVKDSPVFIPNIFSPNGDGFNDYFTVFTGNDVERVEELSIYNRWGANVFNKKNFIPNDELLGWNGIFKEQYASLGVYTYFVRVRLINGDSKIFTGDLTLIK